MQAHELQPFCLQSQYLLSKRDASAETVTDSPASERSLMHRSHTNCRTSLCITYHSKACVWCMLHLVHKCWHSCSQQHRHLLCLHQHQMWKQQQEQHQQQQHHLDQPMQCQLSPFLLSVPRLLLLPCLGLLQTALQAGRAIWQQRPLRWLLWMTSRHLPQSCDTVLQVQMRGICLCIISEQLT